MKKLLAVAALIALAGCGERKAEMPASDTAAAAAPAPMPPAPADTADTTMTTPPDTSHQM